MRTIQKLCSIGACLVPLMSATPALAVTEYMGGGFLELSDECAQHGWNDRQQVLMRVEPQGLRGNSRAETQVALFFATGTIAFRFDLRNASSNGGFRADYEIHQATYVWNGPYSPEEPTMRMFVGYRQGIDFDANDRGAGFEIFNLENFNEHQGCTATFYVALAPN